MTLLKKTAEAMNVADLDEETNRMVERIVVLRVATKHINLWKRQLEMKRKEICELAGLMELEDVKNEIRKEKNLERWANRSTNHFTKKMKRLLYEEIDNMVWSGKVKEITHWCKNNKVFDEITDDEIEEIWGREPPDENEPVRLNGKYVWETAKRVCDYINAHEDLIHITTFSEYQVVMRKVMVVIKEAHIVERKRRQTARKRKSEEIASLTQRAKTLICEVKRGGLKKEEIERRLVCIFGE